MLTIESAKYIDVSRENVKITIPAYDKKTLFISSFASNAFAAFILLLLLCKMLTASATATTKKNSVDITTVLPISASIIYVFIYYTFDFIDSLYAIIYDNRDKIILTTIKLYNNNAEYPKVFILNTLLTKEGKNTEPIIPKLITGML